jgi:hypothetical protein
MGMNFLARKRRDALLGEKECGLFIEFRIGAHEQEEFLDQLSD